MEKVEEYFTTQIKKCEAIKNPVRYWSAPSNAEKFCPVCTSLDVIEEIWELEMKYEEKRKKESE